MARHTYKDKITGRFAKVPIKEFFKEQNQVIIDKDTGKKYKGLYHFLKQHKSPTDFKFSYENFLKTIKSIYGPNRKNKHS